MPECQIYKSHLGIIQGLDFDLKQEMLPLERPLLQAHQPELMHFISFDLETG